MASERISQKLILEQLLKRVGCSDAEYKNWPISGGKYVAIVRCKAEAKLDSEEVGLKVYPSGACGSAELAEEEAAEEAIRYMKRSLYVDVGDTKYWDRLASGLENHEYVAEMRMHEQRLVLLEDSTTVMKDGWEYTIRQVEELPEYVLGLPQAQKSMEASIGAEGESSEGNESYIADIATKLACLATYASKALKRSTEELE